MKDTSPSNVKRGVRIIDQNGNLLYDRREVFPLDELYVELRGVSVELFIMYLAIHWPNHWAIKALAEDVHRGIIRAGTIEDLSQEIELTEEDAKTLKAIGEGKSPLL